MVPQRCGCRFIASGMRSSVCMFGRKTLTLLNSFPTCVHTSSQHPYKRTIHAGRVLERNFSIVICHCHKQLNGLKYIWEWLCHVARTNFQLTVTYVSRVCMDILAGKVVYIYLLAFMCAPERYMPILWMLCRIVFIQSVICFD